MNRLNGEVTIKVVGCGLWRSKDLGKTWVQVDGDVIGGRDETGWASTADPNQPNRMASFSLDGGAGWCLEEASWRKFATLGRNWDYGSVDWGASSPRTIIAAKHETSPPGEVYLSSDGGVTWKQLSIHLTDKRDRPSVVGAMGGEVLIYSRGEGILRSTNSGASWHPVSSVNPQTRIPVLFQGAHYLGTATGLLVSRDQGVSWQTQGGAVSIWLGPFFGRDAQEMLVVGEQGAFVTRDAGSTWKQVASLKPKEGGFAFSVNWFGCYAWDPLHNLLYASAMGNPVYQLELSH